MEEGCDLRVESNLAADTFPAKARFGLGEQLRRASLSIRDSVEEGRGRGGDREFSRHLRIARGSATDPA